MPAAASHAARRSAAARLLTPRSILVAGVSPRPGSLGRRVLGNLVESGYAGTIHVIGRKPATIFGLECVTGFDQLPRDIDLALLTTSAAGTLDLVRECAAHGVGAAVCYASGFAEDGEEGRCQEAELERLARAGGIGLIGPNCFGFLNTADRLPTLLASISPVPAAGGDTGPGVAVIAQSGGIGAYVAGSLGSRGVPISYLVTTGNEAGLGAPDLIEFFAGDERTGVVAVYAEQVRDPRRFTAAVRRAELAGKRVVLMHPGRGERSRAAMLSHTGSLAGDHAVMTTVLAHAGVAVVDGLESLIDLSELLLRHPRPPVAGPAVITVSGALCAIMSDGAEALGLDLPAPTPVADDELAGALDFTEVGNPMDLGTQPLTQPELLRLATRRMAGDPGIGSVLVSLPTGGEPLDSTWFGNVLDGARGSAKPLVYVHQNEQEPPAGFRDLVLRNRIVFHRSPERALRALAHLTEFGRTLAAVRAAEAPPVDVPALGSGPQPEWLGKQVLARLGVSVPDGGLARTADEAVAVAARVGYPVAVKAQTAGLTHKSDAGGVLLGIGDEAGLRHAWTGVHEAVAATAPDIALDGVLVERMIAPGVEMVVGARRDPLWGPVLLVGSGGVLTEVVDDVRLLPADASVPMVVEEVERLKAARLFGGFRGAAPADVTAVAEVAAALGRLMLAVPSIAEVDINPLVVHPSGAVALDALVVTAPGEAAEAG